ncbi:lipoyl(octanoyl) transferase [Venturia nashicola]|nr:lipoyl(octanoyl) transferase [Venturia nashicola]
MSNKLRHVALQGFSHFKGVHQLQETLVNQFLAFKKGAQVNPNPHVITSQLQPVYTTGRRDVGKLSNGEIDYLTAETPNGRAEFYPALRGGQTTYHGPGQLTAYPIIDLKHHGLSARSYVHLLEEVLIKTCARFDLKAFRTKDTGVWVSKDRKVGSIGVHMRRHVTSHGIALNITDAVKPWFERIVACGLAGKQATSLYGEGCNPAELDTVEDIFVEELAKAIPGIEGVYQHYNDMFSIPMPEEFASLLSHIAIIADTDVDGLSPDDKNAMAECLEDTLRDLVVEEIEKSAIGPLRPGQLFIHFKRRTSENLASIVSSIYNEGSIDA